MKQHKQIKRKPCRKCGKWCYYKPSKPLLLYEKDSGKLVLHKHDYPSRSAARVPGLDNLGIWIWGNQDYSMDGTIHDTISDKLQDIEKEITSLENRVSRYHIKTVKGKEYWYLVENGQWFYVGKQDPRAEIQKQIAERKLAREARKKKMMSCIIKKHNGHLVIDVRAFKEHIDRKLPENMVLISDVLKGVDNAK